MNLSTQHPIMHVTEVELQRRIISWVEETGGITEDVEGVPIQILSLGEWNNKSGPDFIGCAVLRAGSLLVGNAEVHFRASDWFTHRHHTDVAYADVVLHLFCYGNDNALPQLPCSVRLPLYLIQKQSNSMFLSGTSSPTEIMLDIQDYSFQRLKRKSLLFQEYLRTISFQQSVAVMLDKFLHNDKNRRPSFFLSAVQQHTIVHYIHTTINEQKSLNAENILSTSWAGEGKNMRCELFVNIMLPILYGMGEKFHDESLKMWWNTKSFHIYKHLQRRFPDIHQEYIWQQQGLLEWEFYQQKSRTPEPHAVKEHECSYDVRQSSNVLFVKAA